MIIRQFLHQEPVGIAYSQMSNSSQAGGWLKKLAADKQVEAIDRQLRGFDMAMFEVNYRYTENVLRVD